MPFLRGTAPIRRTLEYLEKGKLVFKVMKKYLQSIDHNLNSVFFVRRIESKYSLLITIYMEKIMRELDNLSFGTYLKCSTRTLEFKLLHSRI